MTRTYEGQLEVDADRGVIYFHSNDPEAALKYGGQSLLRICQLPTPIPERALDITHLVGVNWGGKPGFMNRIKELPKAKEQVSQEERPDYRSEREIERFERMQNEG